MVTAADAARVAAAFRPGMRVYVQGGAGEPLALRRILEANPGALQGVTLVSGLIPGINGFDYAALEPTARLETFMLPGALRASFEAGKVAVRPLAYAQIAEHLAEGPPFDLAILQVSPPDAEGHCSFGVCSDFPGLVWPRAQRRLAFVNAAWPAARRGPAIPQDRIDLAIGDDTTPLLGEDGRTTPEQAVIADHIAALVPDRAALQTGVGAVPASALAGLKGRRGLVIRSGMVTQAYRALHEAGALDPTAEHITGLAHGPLDFLDWAATHLIFADARTTHGAAALARAPRLHAINSALEVDLFGQANIEWREGKLVSGLGGAPDFARAAKRSPGGRAILALPATAAGGKISRIVPRLDAPCISIPRDDTDLVITENGVADLRGASLEGRAEALIAIAAPRQRAALSAAWEAMRSRF
jgi:acyl-CoA hydrolase